MVLLVARTATANASVETFEGYVPGPNVTQVTGSGSFIITGTTVL
jgi:hypothetical protein